MNENIGVKLNGNASFGLGASVKTELDTEPKIQPKLASSNDERVIPKIEPVAKREAPIKLDEINEVQKRPVFLTGLLTLLLIASYIFTLKDYDIATNIIVSGGIILYPFTFLIISFISKKYGFKEARRSIFVSALLYITFIILIIIAVTPKANTATSGYNAIVQYVFVNNIKDIGGFSLFYPTLGQFFGLLIAYVVSHLLYATIYNAIHRFTIDYLAVGLGLFIAYIVDRLLFIPILYAKGLSTGANTFEYLIKVLTSEFIVGVGVAVLLVIVYMIINVILKAIKKN